MIKYFPEIIQGSPDWFSVRCGLLTSSEMNRIITPKKLQYAENEKEKFHLYELAAQRITKYVEPSYISDDMLRGKQDELDAKIIYNEKFAPLQEVGFITNDKWGFTIGYSPDATVAEDGQVEVKGRRQKFQIETITTNKMPEEYIIQVQTGLLVSEREWCDFISYCGGLPMKVIRIYPDEKVQTAIIEASRFFHEKLTGVLTRYAFEKTAPGSQLIPTERRIEQEITI